MGQGGDQNSALFLRSIRQRQSINRIYKIKDKEGCAKEESNGIEKAFLSLYEELLGSNVTARSPVNSTIIKKGKVVSFEDQNLLCKAFTKADVKLALWQTPGPDGYNSQFFKDNWCIVEEDVCEAILDFFEIGKLLTQVNATTITLIPKTKSPESVNEFRPISCCNTIYKCISKMLCNRLSKVLLKIIDEAQCAFVEGRKIIQNVLLCEELTKGFNRKGG